MLDDNQFDVDGVTSGGTGRKLAKAVIIGHWSLVFGGDLDLLPVSLLVSLCSLQSHANSIKSNMATNEELSETPPATICYPNTAHGSNILRSFVGECHVAYGRLLPRSSP